MTSTGHFSIPGRGYWPERRRRPWACRDCGKRGRSPGTAGRWQLADRRDRAWMAPILQSRNLPGDSRRRPARASACSYESNAWSAPLELQFDPARVARAGSSSANRSSDARASSIPCSMQIERPGVPARDSTPPARDSPATRRPWDGRPLDGRLPRPSRGSLRPPAASPSPSAMKPRSERADNLAATISRRYRNRQCPLGQVSGCLVRTKLEAVDTASRMAIENERLASANPVHHEQVFCSASGSILHVRPVFADRCLIERLREVR